MILLIYTYGFAQKIIVKLLRIPVMSSHNCNMFIEVAYIVNLVISTASQPLNNVQWCGVEM